LPGRTEHLSDRLLEALVGVGDHQLHPGKPAADQAAQDLAPERLGLGRADIDTDNLPLATGVHAVGDHQRAVLDPPAGADLLDLGVQPPIPISTLQGPLPKRGDLLIQATAQPRHLILAHPGQPEGLHQPVHLAGRDPVDIGLLDDRDQRLLRAAARRQEARKVRAVPQLGDGQLDRPDPGIPGPLPVAVTADHPDAAALTVTGTGGLGDLGLHQLLSQPAHGLAQHVGVLVSKHLADQLAHAHPAHVGHHGAPLVGSKAPTILGPRWPTYRHPHEPVTPRNATLLAIR
jgi:hypothetical protein